MSQTFDDFELIIVNDGSTDSSIEIINSYKKKHSKIKVFNQSNTGVAIARQRALEQCSGKFFIFIDADDWVEKDYLEKFYSVLKQGDYDLLYCDFFNHKNGLDKKVEQNFGDSKLFCIEKLLSHEMKGFLWNKVFKKDIVKTYGISFDSDFDIWEDLVFCIKFFVFLKSFRYIDNCGYHYNDVETSLVRSVSIKKIEDQFRANDSIKKILEDNNMENIFKKEIEYSYLFAKKNCLFSTEIGKYWESSRSLKINSLLNNKLKFRFKFLYFLCFIKQYSLVYLILTCYHKFLRNFSNE